MIKNPTSFIAKRVLGQLCSEALPDEQRLDEAVHIKHLQAGDCLFSAEEQHPNVYFIRDGIIKMVYETMDGNAWVKAFSESGMFFASLTALKPGGKTSFSTYAVCKTTIEQVPYKVLLELAEVHPVWQKILRRAFEIYGFKKETREKELLTLSAEERYVQFIKNREQLAARLTDRDIASYIRVTPVALSRIKRRVRGMGSETSV